MPSSFSLPLTSKKALHDVSPLELVATHVYVPESESWNTIEKTGMKEHQSTHLNTTNEMAISVPNPLNTCSLLVAETLKNDGKTSCGSPVLNKQCHL